MVFRLLFGRYIAGMDPVQFRRKTSALTALFIHGLLGAFVAVFLLETRVGLFGIIGLDSVFLVLQVAFMALTLSQIADAGPHSPAINVEATILRVTFSILMLALAVKT